MPTAPHAIERFLAAKPNPTIDIKSKDAAWCLDYIERIFGDKPRFKTQPRLSQVQGLAFGLWAKRVLWYWEPRTGKTKLSLDWLSFLRRVQRVHRALIIAHAPIGIDEWEGQYKTHSDLDIRFIRSGGKAWNELCDALESSCDAVCTTWSTMQTMFAEKRTVKQGSKAGRQKFYPDLKRLRAVAEYFDCAIIDEIHKAMNDQRLRFKIGEELVQHCNYRAGLTGTPFGRNPFVLWAEAYLIDSGAALTRSRYFFEEAFGERQYHHFNRSGVQYVFPKVGTRAYSDRMSTLRGKLQHMMMPLSLSEIQDTNVIAGTVNLTMRPKQRLAYREAIQGYIELVKDQDKSNRIAIENIFLRLRQIASGFVPIVDPDTGDQHLLELDCAKLEWLEDFFSGGADVKTVIFHDYTFSGQRVSRLLSKLKIRHGWIYGGTKHIDRVKIREEFQQGDLPIVISNAATGGTAIDLSAADYLLFFESPPGVIARRQAESRPLARGERLLVMDDMISAPIEQKILDFARQGEDLLNALVRNPKSLSGLLGI